MTDVACAHLPCRAASLRADMPVRASVRLARPVHVPGRAQQVFATVEKAVNIRRDDAVVRLLATGMRTVGHAQPPTQTPAKGIAPVKNTDISFQKQYPELTEYTQSILNCKLVSYCSSSPHDG